MRRRGMGKDPLDWIGERGEERSSPLGLEEAVLAGIYQEPDADLEARPGGATRTWGEVATAELAKYLTLVPVTARLAEEQVDYLETMQRRIMRSRRRRRERITKNTIIRAAIELVRRLPWDYRDIADEEELVQRLLQAVGLPPEK